MIDTSVMSVGVDVGKSKLDISCLRVDKSVVHQVFSNDKKGLKGMVQFLQKQRTASTVPCVLEATGDYHLLASLRLVEAGLAVKCINPIVSSKYRRASVRNAKSDKIDSARLAEIGILEHELPAFVETRESIGAKKLLSSVAQLETLRQQLAGHLQQLAETSRALGIRAVDRDARKALENMDRQIETYRLKICAAAPKEAAEISAMTPGVSQQQVSVLLVALGDKEFINRDQLVAFVGLDVRLRQSGKWVGKQVLSKRGNGYLRKVLFQIGWGLKTHHERYQEKYLSMRARGVNYKTCVIAMARKFLRFLFAYYWKRTIGNGKAGSLSGAIEVHALQSIPAMSTA